MSFAVSRRVRKNTETSVFLKKYTGMKYVFITLSLFLTLCIIVVLVVVVVIVLVVAGGSATGRDAVQARDT